MGNCRFVTQLAPMKIIPLSEGSFTIDKTKLFVPFDEQRANKVFEYQREFENKIRSEIMERKMEQRPGARRFKAGLP